MKDFPPPPGADEFSELVEQRLADTMASGGTRETVTVDWHGKPRSFEVIDVPIDRLYFNPATHRIRAQRTHNPARDAALDSDPFSAASQGYLLELLQAEPKNPKRRDPDFDELLKSLKEFGQNEPGLITHHGVLVNGNTRAAALRELGVQSMRVGVLPKGTTWDDINKVELSLQLRPDNRREYSYINRLLAMEEQALLGRSPGVIAKEFRVQVRTYEQERWILGVIREQIERSKAGNAGAGLRLIDFEDHQEKLKELHRAYFKVHATDPDKAEALKEMRLAAINLGFAKTEVRVIDDAAKFRKNHLDRHLPAKFTTPEVADEPVVVPGLGVAVSTTTTSVAAARALNDQVLKAKAAALAKGGDGDTGTNAENGAFHEIKEAFRGAVRTAENQLRIEKLEQQAPARLNDACLDIIQCVNDLARARGMGTLDEEAFDEAVLNLRTSLRKLAHQAGRGLQHPGEGVAWLIEAAAVEGTK